MPANSKPPPPPPGTECSGEKDERCGKRTSAGTTGMNRKEAGIIWNLFQITVWFTTACGGDGYRVTWIGRLKFLYFSWNFKRIKR
jgi:hypothetical protein